MALDFERAPFLVIWEVSRACALACVHCRADAIPRRDPRELTTEEGLRLVDQARSFGTPPPLLVLTGGDRRPHAQRHGHGDTQAPGGAEGRGPFRVWP